jgi:hypothetical protein
VPQNVRDYLYAGLLGATPVFVIVGLVMLWRASSFEGYIGALIVLTLAACSFLGARELKPAEVNALFDHLRGKKNHQDGPTAPSNGAGPTG